MERAGKAATANEAPTNVTGALWKLRAMLNTVRLPAAIREARFVKKANVIGSIGWLTRRGIVKRTNSPIWAVRSSQSKPMRNEEPRSPTSRLPRCRIAPRTAPTAAA